MSLTLLLAILILSVGVLVSGFEFDHDVDAELCKKETFSGPGICTSNSTMWYSCPITCAGLLSGSRGTMSEERDDPEQFYELRVQRAQVPGSSSDNGSGMSLEENEGYITLYAVLPMLPGIAQYYYNAIEHIAHVYKYTVVAMILPYYSTTDKQDDSVSGNADSIILETILEERTGAGKIKKRNAMVKSILLEGYSAEQESENDVLKYLLSREVVGVRDGSDSDQKNEDDHMLFSTRPNIFLVSYNGMFMERLVSPTMEMIERRIKVYELGMEKEYEL